MTEEKAMQILSERLGKKIVAMENPRKRRVYLFVNRENLIESGKFLFFDMGCRLCIATALETPEGIEIIYHYYHDDERVMINLKTLAPKPGLNMPSLGAHFEAANWIEREMAELYGVTFEGHPDPRRLLMSDDWPEGVYPFRSDFDPTLVDDSRVGRRED